MQPNTFIDYTKDLGYVTEGQVTDVFFQRGSNLKKIQKIDVDCVLCLSGHDMIDAVMIRYKAGDIPQQILDRGETQHVIERGATVVYTDNTTDRLEITGFLVKK